MTGRVRNGRRVGTWAGLAALLVAGFLGCGGDQPGRVDEAVVVPSEPLPTGGGGGGTTATTSPGSTDAGVATASNSAATPAPAAVSAEGWGTLKGRVVFNGTPPDRPTLDTSSKDPEVCAKVPVKSERIVVDPGTKGVKNVLVYIPKPTRTSPEAESAAKQAEVVFDQDHCVFEPHVMAFMKGATVKLKSSDPVNHNVNAKLRNNAAYNQLVAPNATMDYSPLTSERSPAQVVCDIHPWMQAYWLITDSPYFAVTDEQGNFEIKDVPAGTQKVVAWQEAAGYLSASAGDPVAIKAGDATTQEFQVDAAKVK